MARLVGAFLGVLAALASPHLVWAQAGASAVTGVVTDQAGAAVAGATIVAIDRGMNVMRTVVTSAAGVYAIAGLRPGLHTLTVDHEGFRREVRDALTLLTGQTVRLDFVLMLESRTEAVTVIAPQPLAISETAGLGHVVDGRRVVDLPLNGRSFVSLVALAPGVALPPGGDFPRINGGRPRTNEYLFDGISVLQPEPGQVAFLPIVDAIQDFKVESNSPPAEFGRFNGGVVNLTTKAGTNAVRGSVFDFVRHEALNARNLFAPRTPQNPDTPRFRRTQAGAVLGGPLVRNRTFFFVSYQHTDQEIARVRVSTVPTLLQRQGIFTEPVNGRDVTIFDPATTTPKDGGGFTRAPFADGRIPVDRMDPVALALLQRFPLPTGPGTSNNYTRVGNEVVGQNQYDVRIDQRIGQGNRIFGRLSHFRDDTLPVSPLPDGSGALASGAIGPTRTSAWSFASNYQSVLRGRLLHELRVGYTRRAVSRRGVALSGTASDLSGIPGIPGNGRFSTALPTILIDGSQHLGSPANAHSDFRTDVTQIVDTITWTTGRHTVKAGLDFRWSRLDVFQPPSPTGSFRFSSLFTDLPGTGATGSPLASFLLGQVQTFSIDLQSRTLRPRAHVQEYFIQDDWTASSRVTINAGLRYTLNFPSVEADDQGAVFNLETRELEYLGRDGNSRSARRLQKLNFGPRLGVSARLSDDTVVRSGFALVWIEQSGITTPFTAPQFPFLQSVSQRSVDNVTPAFHLEDGPTVSPVGATADAGLGQGVFAVDRDLGSGYVQQWHAALRRAVGSSLSVEVAYVGSQITRVGLPDSNINQLSAEQLALGPELLTRVPNPYADAVPPSSSIGDDTIPLAQLLRPYPEYTTVSLYRNNTGTTHYHGVEFRIDHRPWDGLSYGVSYTRSRLMDDASSVFDAAVLTGPVASYTVADSFNPALERDVSNGDIPHAFVASLVWDVPFGTTRSRPLRRIAGVLLNDWTVTAVVRLQSGLPLATTQATNHNAFAGFGTQRPNLHRDPSLPAEERTLERWFDTSAFSEAPQFTLGNSSRNPVRGPGYRNVDLALIRRVGLPRGTSLEIRGETFNLTNTPPLGAPNTVYGTPGFGSITSAGDPRVIQVALKWIF